MKKRIQKLLDKWNNIPSKFAAIIWTFWGIKAFIQNPTYLFPDYFIVMIFGYFMFCGFATLMYHIYRDIKNSIISGHSDTSDSTTSIPTKIGKFSSTMQQNTNASNKTVFDENEILNNLVTIIPRKENNTEKPKEDLLADEVLEEDISFFKTQGTPILSASFEHVSALLEKAKRSAETIITTIDRTTFENSLAELKNTLTYLTKYEKYDLFSESTPTQDLKRLLETEPKARAAFEERVLTNSSAAPPMSDIDHTPTSNYKLDPLFADAGRFIVEKDRASIGMLQRVFKIGFNRAVHIVDQLCEYGVVGEEVGTAPRKVLVDIEQFEILLCKIKCGYEPTIPPNEDDISPVIRKNTNIDKMEGHEFEEYCAKLLEHNGFINVIVTQGSGDHGIDILAEKDDVSYAIQCKCYSSNIGNAAIQQALAGKKYYKRDIAVVLTNQYFTSQAKDEAKVFGVKLWDRDKLNDLIEKSNL